MAVAAILDFQKVEIATVDPLPGDKMRHLAKFYQHRSKGCRDMPVFFQNGDRPPSLIS